MCKKWAKNKEKWAFFKCRYVTQGLQILQIWLHIRIALEMYLQQIMNQIFDISTPSTLKMGSKLANITKIAIFTNIDVKELINYDIGEGDGATSEALAEDGKSIYLPVF